MFRLISLKINNHPFLGSITKGLDFVPKTELNNSELPYTTVIIGPNGTGKSTLLAVLVEIFEDLERCIIKPRYVSKVRYSYHLNFQNNGIEYLIQYNPFIGFSNKTLSGHIKRGLSKSSKTSNFKILINGKSSSLNSLVLPKKIIALSFLTSDRFRFKKNEPDDFYLYLGLRDKSNTARANSFLNNTLPILLEYVQKANSVDFLKRILNFLGFNDDYLGITYEYRYKQHFFKGGNLQINRFIYLFENHQNFSDKKDIPFGVKYYQSTIKNNPQLIQKIVNYINKRSIEDSITVGKKSILNINLLDQYNALDDLYLLNHLRKLDLISSASLRFKKGKNINLEADQMSSGEFHFLTTIIAIQSSICENSLLLIDEPEISFHPNFQMKYMYFLKNAFSHYNSSHFIIATHSHFLVSDLEGKTSEVIALNGEVPNITANPVQRNTYGWSAEEVLYKVFGVRSTRNYYLEIELRDLLQMISSNSKNAPLIQEKISNLSKVVLSNEDPLNLVITQVKSYLEKL